MKVKLLIVLLASVLMTGCQAFGELMANYKEIYSHEPKPMTAEQAADAEIKALINESRHNATINRINSHARPIKNN